MVEVFPRNKVADLLSTGTHCTEHTIKLNAQGFFSAASLPDLVVGSAEDAIGAIERGTRRRRTALTGMNQCSSRGHAAVTVTIKRRGDYFSALTGMRGVHALLAPHCSHCSRCSARAVHLVFLRAMVLVH
jgi:hypothetical protein